METNPYEHPLMEGKDICKLIPQREPVVMVDAFYGLDEAGSYTGFTVPHEHLFVVNGKLDECGLIEHIAQSAAARIGYICLQENREIPVGFIGSVDKMTIHMLPAAGAVIRTEIRILQEILDITLISAKVWDNVKTCAEGQMKIYLNPVTA